MLVTVFEKPLFDPTSLVEKANTAKDLPQWNLFTNTKKCKITLINLLGINISRSIKARLLSDISPILDCELGDQQNALIEDYILKHLNTNGKSVEKKSTTFLNIYQKFCVQLARHYHNELNVNKSVSVIERVSSPFADTQTYVNYLLMVGKLQTWSERSVAISGEISAAHVSFYAAVNGIRGTVFHNKWGNYSEQCELQSLITEVFFETSRHLMMLSLPIIACILLRDGLELAQKLILPLWTCDMLISLTWLDLNVHKLDDAKMKLNNIEYILGLNSKSLPGCTTPVPNTIAFDDDDDVRQENARETMDGCESPLLGKNNENVMYSEESVASISGNTECLRIFIDLAVLRGVLLIVKKRYRAAVTVFNSASKIISSMERKFGNDKVFRNHMSRNKTIICFYHSVMLEKNRNYSSSLQYLEKALQFYNSGSSNLHLHAITSKSILSKINVVEYKLMLLKDPVKLEESRDTFKVPSSYSIASSRETVKTPPAGSQIPVAVTPLLHSNSSRKLKSVLTPGNVPVFTTNARKLFNSNEDDDEDDEFCMPLSNVDKQESSRKPIKTYQSVNKRIVSQSARKTKLVKNLDVEKLTKSVSKITIYNDDDGENKPTTSVKPATRVFPGCKKKLPISTTDSSANLKNENIKTVRNLRTRKK